MTSRTRQCTAFTSYLTSAAASPLITRGWARAALSTWSQSFLSSAPGSSPQHHNWKNLRLLQRSISLPRIIPHSGTWQERHHSVSISVLTQSILSWKRKQVTKDHADAANGLEDKLDAAWKFPKLHRTLYNENQWNVLKRHCMIVSRIQRTSVLTLHYLESATILKSKSQVSLDTTRHPGEPPQICIGLWLLSRDPVCYKDEKVRMLFLSAVHTLSSGFIDFLTLLSLRRNKHPAPANLFWTNLSRNCCSSCC